MPALWPILCQPWQQYTHTHTHKSTDTDSQRDPDFFICHLYTLSHFGNIQPLHTACFFFLVCFIHAKKPYYSFSSTPYLTLIQVYIHTWFCPLMPQIAVLCLKVPCRQLFRKGLLFVFIFLTQIFTASH